MRAPEMEPCGEKCTSMNLPKRDELLLRTVFALPNASITGLKGALNNLSRKGEGLLRKYFSLRTNVNRRK